jgi:hypothetical protein
MGNIVQHKTHTYAGKSFNQHLYSIQKRVAKALARSQAHPEVIFVGETHRTADERRRAAIFGARPGSDKLLTVLERGMGLATAGPHLVIEPLSALGPFDQQRNVNVVGQIAAAFRIRAYQAVLILFGEDHDDKFRTEAPNHPALPDLIWHSYPSFHDHMMATHQVFGPYDPRGSGYVLLGMIRTQGKNVLDLMQLCEGALPATPNGIYRIAVQSPFADNPDSNFAIFARPPVSTHYQANLHVMGDILIPITIDLLPSLKVMNIEGKVRPVPGDLRRPQDRRDAIEVFWADAT